MTQCNECNCPPLHDVFRHGVTTKPPCPVHDTPERLAQLAEILVPRAEGSDPHHGHVAHSASEPCIPQCPLYDRWAGGGYRRIAELEAEVAKLSESGLRLSDQAISLGCRHARTVDGAWDEAVGRLREVYDAQIARFPGCTLTLAIERSTTGDPLPGTERP